MLPTQHAYRNVILRKALYSTWPIGSGPHEPGDRVHSVPTRVDRRDPPPPGVRERGARPHHYELPATVRCCPLAPWTCPLFGPGSRCARSMSLSHMFRPLMHWFKVLTTRAWISSGSSDLLSSLGADARCSASAGSSRDNLSPILWRPRQPGLVDVVHRACCDLRAVPRQWWSPWLEGHTRGMAPVVAPLNWIQARSPGRRPL